MRTSLTPSAAEKHLVSGLKTQRDTMRRRGIAPDVVDAELRALELAIRAEIWRRVLLPGGAA